MAAGEVVADAAEIVSEESAQVAEAARALSSRDTGFLFGGVGIGFALGFAGGYLLLKKKLELKYESLADEEIAGMKEHYNAKVRALDSEKEKLDRLRTVDTAKEKTTLDGVVDDLEYRSEGNDGHVPYHQVGSEPDKPVTNVFNQPEPDVEMPDWDYSEEVKSRSEDSPYVIHKDEYTEGKEGYEQHTLTYFEGDDVLGDERDRVIEDQDETIGVANLSKFGHGSGDPNIVYIRNEEMKVDIEVVHSDGKFATEVHGFQDDELQHSSMRRRSPRRSDYDSSD